MRYVKPNTQKTSILSFETPAFLYRSPVKTEKKRPCSSIFEIPNGKRAFRYNPYSIPNRELHIPLLLRRPHSIFPRAKGKRSAEEESEQSPSKRLRKEQDNHLLDDDDCCDCNSDDKEMFGLHVLLEGNHCFDREQEMESTSCPSSNYYSTSTGVSFNTSNMPGITTDTTKSALQPFKRRRYCSRVPRPVTFRLEALNLDREEWDMEGVETSSTCTDTSGSSIKSDDAMNLEPPDESNLRPISFFLRQIENFISRPPRPSAQHPYSPWGVLSI